MTPSSLVKKIGWLMVLLLNGMILEEWIGCQVALSLGPPEEGG